MHSMRVFIRRGLLVAPFVFSIPSIAGSFQFFEPVNPPRAFQVMVHRGMAGQAPENTRPAVERAIEDGFEWVEVDVRLTADGRHILLHDETLDRTTDGTGRAAEATLTELQKLDAGSWFADRYQGERLLSLTECLALCKGRINLYLDVKSMDAPRLVDEIHAAEMEDQVVVYGSREEVRNVQSLSRKLIPVMTKWRPGEKVSEFLATFRPQAVEINADELTQGVVEEFRREGVYVQAKALGDWDAVAWWNRCLDAGVDWIQTDLPEELIAHSYYRGTVDPPIRWSLHRGAGRYTPENTFPAFEKSVALHADYIEVDVRAASDGTPFILHDSRLDRTTNGSGAFEELPAGRLRTLDAGSWFSTQFAGVRMPEFEEFLEWLPEDMGHYCDAKDIPPDQLAVLLEKHGVVERTVVFQGVDYLKQLTAIDPRIRALAPLSDPAQVDEYREGWKPYAFDASWRILSRELIDQCHELGIQVYSDGFGDNASVENYRNAIEWGIDVIQTDDPVRVIRAMELVNR